MSGSPTVRPVVATYRLQLHKGFGFAHAMERIPYLQRLGVSHLYLSPVLQAARASMHGYDLVDPTRISDELGGRAGLDQLAKTAHAHGLHLVLDIVPNHMSISDPRNVWWWSVLESGPHSPWAHAFDIDWDAPEPGLKDMVLLPVLSDHRHRVLQRGEVRVQRKGAAFFVRYGEQRFPLAPKSIAPLLRAAAQRCTNQRVAFFADAYEKLEHPGVVSDLLEELLEKSPMCAAALDDGIERVNVSPDLLEQLLDAQSYRLAYWRTAERDLDYRRFFDVNSLVGLHVEDPRVFDASHALIRELLERGVASGLRVDHVDGLANPRAYLERLRALANDAPIWVEKILAPTEQLEPWPVQGTTGYDFANDVAALFVPPRAEAVLSDLAHAESFDEVSADARTQVLDELLLSDVNRLTHTLLELRERHRDMRDYSRHELRALVKALAAAFPVYRSYVEPGRPPSEQTAAVVDAALKTARERNPELDPALFDFARDLFFEKRQGALERRFVERLQQLTGPTMAKGVEDTALYRDVRLLALNEVGGTPARFSLSAAEFHERQASALARWPQRMLALSTHDSKRSADVRARLVAMSHDPEGYAALARDFLGATRDDLDERTRLLALQTLIGAWPLDLPRFIAVLHKSVREAKLQTRWTRADAKYEERVATFAREVLENDALRSTLARYVLELEPHARAISLAWVLLQCTCPGVPDIYQGDELWNHALVDPDNRRAVDFGKRDAALDASALPSVENDELGVEKLHVIRRTLALRRRTPYLFGAYTPLRMIGAQPAAALGFVRGEGAVVVVPLQRVRDWQDTAIELPQGTFESALIVGPRYQYRARLASLLEILPVALLRLV